MPDFHNHLHLIESLLNGVRLTIEQYKESLPLWMKQVATYHLVYENKKIIAGLIKPKQDMEYDLLVKAQRQMEKRGEFPCLLIADKLNPKYRSLFVRNKVPYVYKNDSIFAPGLGFKLTSVDKSLRKDRKPEVINSLITPFELKLLAGFLTDFISDEVFNLNDLGLLLRKNQYDCSKNKLSRATKELIRRGLLIAKDSGPKRKLQFLDKKEIWEYLLDHKPNRTNKIIEGFHVLPSAKQIFSGESALSQFTDLASPVTKSFALTNVQYQKIINGGEFLSKGSEHPQCYYEIRKEDPKLFSVKSSLNPVELYLELRSHSDERVQIALDQMLERFQLKVPKYE